MKRIKYEDIQISIQNYLKQRNLKSTLLETNDNEKTTDSLETRQTLNSKHIKNNLSPNQLFFRTQMNSQKNNLNKDLNLMALNDLVLIESSINDYYSFSFDTVSDQNYLKQFQILKDFLQQTNELNELIYPFFVYMCIDLITLGYSIKPVINKFEIKNDKFCQIREDLNLFNEIKDLSKCRLVLKWMNNKYQMKLSSRNWKKFMNFLSKSNVNLFIRLLNLHLKITIDELVNEQEDEEEEEEQKMEKKESFTNVKIESNDQYNMIKNEAKYSSNASLSLASLKEIIEKINLQASRLNGMCSYYLNDYQDCVTSVNISPNTEMISVSSENSSIYLYKLTESKLKSKYSLNQGTNYCELTGGHSSAVFKSKFTHDSKYLLSCGDDNMACLWNVCNSNFLNLTESENDEDDDLFENKIKSSFNHSNLIQTSLVTSYSGHLYSVWDLELYSQLNFFATASKDATARLWSFDRIYPLRIFTGHQSDVNCVKFHPNGAYLATGSSDKTVRLWSISTGEFVRLFSGHRSRVYCLAFSPDGSYLASAGEDKKIKIYDLRSGLIYKEFKGHSDTVHSLSFDNKSEILCSGSLDKTVKFWDFHQKSIKIGSKLSYEDSSITNFFVNSNQTTSSPSTSNELIKSVSVDFNVYSVYCDMQNVFHINGAKKVTSQTRLESDSQLDIESNIKLIQPVQMQQKNQRIETKLTKSQKTLSTTIPNLPETRSSSINTRSSRRNLSESHLNDTEATSSTSVNNSYSYLFNNDEDLYEI